MKTRKHTSSFKEKYKAQEMPPAEIEGLLERKQELQTGGKKATIRSWKYYYTVLCGQLLCFFKDKEAFHENSAAAPPIVIHQSHCEIATDYTKKKNVLRLKLNDGAEYLLMANSQNEMVDWLSKIQFHAVLPPAQQLTQYDPELAQKIGGSPVSQPGHRGSTLSTSSTGSHEPPALPQQPPSPSSSHSSRGSDDQAPPSPQTQPPPQKYTHTMGGPVRVSHDQTDFNGSSRSPPTPTSRAPPVGRMPPPEEHSPSPESTPRKEERKMSQSSSSPRSGKSDRRESTGADVTLPPLPDTTPPPPIPQMPVTSPPEFTPKNRRPSDEWQATPPKSDPPAAYNPDILRRPSGQPPAVPSPYYTNGSSSRPEPSRHTMPPSSADRNYPLSQQGARPMFTLPPGSAPPQYDDNANKSATLDKNKSNKEKEKKHSSVFGGLFKKKHKDK
jgi:spectrin beta